MHKHTIQTALSNLSGQLEGAIYFNDEAQHRMVLQAYATDASVYQEKPLAVSLPKSEADLKKLVAFAGEFGISLIPRAAGTSLAGQVVGNGIVVDISKYFNRVIEVNVEQSWVRLQPGVIRDDLNKILRKYGLLFGPETSTANRAMIGGMIGNNSSGLHSIVWGDTRNSLLEARVLLDDGSEAVFSALNQEQLAEKLQLKNREGEIYRSIVSLLEREDVQQAIDSSYPKKSITRRNTGYALDLLLDSFRAKREFNLCTLLAGSEGTLGIVLEAKLKLIPLPQPEIGILCIHCHSIVEAMHANIIALQQQPESSELVDKYILDFTKDHPTYKHNRFFIEGDPEALLMVEFRAATADVLYEQAEKLVTALNAAKIGYAYPFIVGPEETNKVWDVRKAGLGLIRNLPGDTQPVNLIEDCAVDPLDLPSYVKDIQELLDKHGVKASYYAHAGAGELHIEPLINLKSPQGLVAFRGILADTAKLVKKYQGSLSGEHGDGRLRGEFIPEVLGDEVYALLKRVKESFDSRGLFNKGKIVDTPPMDQFLRFEVEAQSGSGSVSGRGSGSGSESGSGSGSGRGSGKLRPQSTVFDFSKDESILRLAEKCSGSGDCRKSHVAGGTMCPSFMATREEKDSTRARANMLRNFLSHSPKDNPFDHEELREVMDLCLSCKACKTECPSGVDVAKMKAEFLQHYYDANGTPFRAWMIANFSRSQRLASMLPDFYNWLINFRPIASLLKRSLGFAQDRSLPEVGNITLRDWMRKREQLPPLEFADYIKKVYLFCDEFTNFNDLEIGQKTVELLTALGYEVHLADAEESGRAHLSKGLLRNAKKIATRNVSTLADLVTEQTPLLGIEPSAILTFRDEYPDLVDAGLRDKAVKLGKHALTIEEFLLAEMEAGRIREDQFKAVNLLDGGRKLKLHAHCYQKAFNLVDTVAKVLSFPSGNRVEIIPSGCCGMAGSFGYEAEHFEISQKVGELVLLPAVRNAAANEWIVAPGTSCRHQIKDGTQRRAYHSVEILWDLLRK